jgi:hypothetical protein
LINLDRSIEMARADGWSDDEIPVLLASLVQFTLGFLLYETGRLEHGPFHDNVVRLRSLVSDPSGLPEGEVRGMVLQQFLPDRAEETFEAGVTALYDGLLSRRS